MIPTETFSGTRGYVNGLPTYGGGQNLSSLSIKTSDDKVIPGFVGADGGLGIANVTQGIPINICGWYMII